MTSVELATVIGMESRAVADYRAAAGKVFWTHVVTGYGAWPESPDDSDTFRLDKPILVRVSATLMDHRSSREDVLHWNDEWLDPIWEVDILSGLPSHMVGMYGRFTFVDGLFSYNRLTGERIGYARNLIPLTEWERLMLWCGLIGRRKSQKKDK